MSKKLLSLLLVLLCALPLCAQVDKNSTLTIKGQVVDSLTNETVPYATLAVALAATPQQPVKMLACDVDGKFETSLKTAGKYIITMQSIGKLPATKSFTVSAKNSPLNLGHLYMADDNQRLGEVTVVAQKPLVKVEVDKLTYSLEDDPEAKTSNSLDMLRKVPMITVDGDDKIELKGSSNYKIYMNGKPSNLLSGDNASDVLKSMPASSIKNIEVITDPGAKYDAEGVGGIINIITTKNALEGYTGTVRADGSTLGRVGGSAYVSLKAGKFGLTANYGYNYRNSPWSDSHSLRTKDGYDSEINGYNSHFEESGRSKFTGPIQYGNLDASYEIDTLNLLSVGANLFNGNMTNRSEVSGLMTGLPAAGSPFQDYYGYDRNSESTSTFGSTDVNVDYQHSTQKKDELLTISYRFSKSPNNNESNTQILNDFSYPLARNYPQWNKNKASTTEHTAQLDYTTPTWKDQTLEAGLKYINRQSKSETLKQAYRDSLQQWEDISTVDSKFRHTQHIYSAYVSYQVKWNKFGAKAGLRAEGTSLRAAFAKAPDMDFETDYFDIVPNATLTYQLDMSSQLRLGYNMRIQRPGIWFLNPYINDANPQNISQGNPDLDSEKSNSLNLNYSKFAQKFSINASLSYTFVNNAIEQYSTIADFADGDPRSRYNGALWNTYGNVGKRQQVGLFLYGNWNPVPLFRIYMNAGLDYTDIKSKALEIEKDGISTRVFLGTQFNLPLDFRINAQGGYFTQRIALQSKYSPFYFAGLNVSKDFLKKKLTLTASASNPFWKTMKMETTTTGEGFQDISTSYRNTREFRLSVSYTFGNLKGGIKKARRGISNDDMKGGESGGGESM